MIKYYEQRFVSDTYKKEAFTIDRLDWTPGLAPLTLAAAFDPSLLEMTLSIPALHGEGVPWPCVDTLFSDPRQPLGFQTFGEDPYLSSLLYASARRALQSAGTPLDKDSVEGILHRGVAASIVLLKNAKRTLPVTGIYFKTIGVMGLYAHELAEALTATAPKIKWLSPAQGSVPQSVTEQSDALILCLGETPSEVPSLTLPPEQLTLFRALADSGKPLIVVVHGSGPLLLDELHEKADALLWAWQITPQHKTVLSHIIMGQESPSGRLPVTFPHAQAAIRARTAPVAEDGKTYLTMRHEPLYPFGYGLSYATFKFSHLRLSSEVIAPGEGVTATCTVQNTGQVGGHEVVQLYLRHDTTNLVGMPRWQLCQMRKLYIRPGEHHEVSFTLPGLTFTTKNEAGESLLQTGRFLLYMGAHQPDARSVWLTESPVLSALLKIEGDPVLL